MDGLQDVVRNGNGNVTSVNNNGECATVWVFGYGSLCWQPGFEYEHAITGHVRGYARKFWQGNTTHRGTLHQPGRVATLVEEPESLVWGRAFEVKGADALPYLNTRECRLGGYLTQTALFYPRSESRSISNSCTRPFSVLLYIATPSNDLWLGDAPLTEIASQIAECSGTSGHNVEYLLRLAAFMRDWIPEAVDDHLFTLEYMVRSRIKELNLSVDTFMGESGRKRRVSQETGQAAGYSPPPPDSFQFTAHVPEKVLRCLNM